MSDSKSRQGIEMCPMTESFISQRNVVLRASVFLVDSYKEIAAISLFGSLVCRNISSLFPVPSVLMGDW